MTRRISNFDSPDRFIAGTVGEPGHRAFFLQARQGGAIVTVGSKTAVGGPAPRLNLTHPCPHPPMPVARY